MTAVGAQDPGEIEKTALRCAALHAVAEPVEEERTELLAAVAASAHARLGTGEPRLAPAEWRLLTHLAG